METTLIKFSRPVRRSSNNMLSIIITHYKTPVLLNLCLDSIKENIKEIDYEVIVVDSESELSVRKMIKRKLTQAKLIRFSKNVGYAKLVNSGIRSAKGEYLFFINADIIISKNAVEQMIDFIKNHPLAGMIGPQLLGFNNLPQKSCFRFPTLASVVARRTFLGKTKWGKRKLDHFLMNDVDLSSPQPVDWIQGSAMLTKKEHAEKIGEWDERFFIYLEDTDWCRRFWQQGYQVIYFPSAKVFHYYGRASKKWGGFLDAFLNKYTWIHLSSAFKYFLKWRKIKLNR